jgi:hypothetical protein
MRRRDAEWNGTRAANEKSASVEILDKQICHPWADANGMITLDEIGN